MPEGPFVGEAVVLKGLELDSVQGFPYRSIKAAWVRSQIPLRINATGIYLCNRFFSSHTIIWTAVTIMAMQLKAKKYIISHTLDLRCPTMKPDRFDFVKSHSLAHRQQLGQCIPLHKEKVIFPRERCLFYKVTQTFMKAPSPWSSHLPWT